MQFIKYIAKFPKMILVSGIIGISSLLTEKETRIAEVAQSEVHQKKLRHMEVKNLFHTMF